MIPLHIMVLRHSAFYSPLLFTMAGGFLREEGIEASYTLASPDNTISDGIDKGMVHVAQSAVATSFMLLEKAETPNHVHFAQINARDGFFISGRTSQPDFKWQDLQGRKILVDHFFQPLAMFKYACHRQGVDFDAIEVIDAGGVDDIDRAFRNNEADYVHQQGPAAQQLEADGIGHVVTSVGEAIGEVAFSSLCASRAWLQTDMAHAFMRPYRRARQYVIEAPAVDIAAAEMKYFPDIDRAVLTHTIASYQQLGCWEPEVVISRQSYEALLDVFEFNHSISRRYAYDEVVVLPPEVGE